MPLATPTQEGDVVVMCHATGEKAVVYFTPYSKAKERYRELNGTVLDDKGEVRGHMTHHMTTIVHLLVCI